MPKAKPLNKPAMSFEGLSEEQIANALLKVLSPGEAVRMMEKARDAAAGNPFSRTYWNDPVAFAHDCINWEEGEGLAPYQEEILTALPNKKRVAVIGPHGLGKTCVASLAVHWFCLTRELSLTDWKLPTTASNNRQLEKFLWPEIHKWAKRLNWAKIGRAPYDERTEFFQFKLKLQFGESFAGASDNPAYMEGAHAKQLLYLFDEAKAIPSATFDATEGAFSNAGAESGDEGYMLMISTPGDPVGRFFDVHTKRDKYPDWWCRHVTLAEMIDSGRISPKWVEDRKRQWGEESAVFRNRVLGEFCDENEAGVIPSRWVEKAQQRGLPEEER